VQISERASHIPTPGSKPNAPVWVRYRGNESLVPTLFFVSPLATSVAPRLTPFLFAIVAITLIVAAVRKGAPWRELLPRTPALSACLLLATYVCVNSTWSVDLGGAFGKAALLLCLILTTFAAVGAAARLEKKILGRAALAFAAGAFAGALFILIELLSDAIMTRTALSWVPLLLPSSPKPKHFEISHGAVLGLKLAQLNRNVNLAMFHLWPGLLGLMGLKCSRRPIAMVLFFMAIVAVVTISEHDSSQVALIGSSVVALLAWKWRRLVIRALAVLWCAAFVLVIPASFAAYQNGLHFSTLLPFSARARIILWNYTAEQTLAHPLLGVGVDSTPALSQQQIAKSHPLGHHAHNLFLQTWFELGAVGALLLAVAGASVVSLIFFLPPSAQPFAAAAFAAFALVGAFAWGMWQTWFLCAVGLLPVYLRVATAAVGIRPTHSTSLTAT
jgi:O-antigen ligase